MFLPALPLCAGNLCLWRRPRLSSGPYWLPEVLHASVGRSSSHSPFPVARALPCPTPESPQGTCGSSSPHLNAPLLSSVKPLIFVSRAWALQAYLSSCQLGRLVSSARPGSWLCLETLRLLLSSWHTPLTTRPSLLTSLLSAPSPARQHPSHTGALSVPRAHHVFLLNTLLRLFPLPATPFLPSPRRDLAQVLFPKGTFPRGRHNVPTQPNCKADWVLPPVSPALGGVS